MIAPGSLSGAVVLSLCSSFAWNALEWAWSSVTETAIEPEPVTVVCNCTCSLVEGLSAGGVGWVYGIGAAVLNFLLTAAGLLCWLCGQCTCRRGHSKASLEEESLARDIAVQEEAARLRATWRA